MSREPSIDRPIRVWYLIGTLSVGGTERTLVDLVSGLDRDQFDLTIWTLTDPGPLADDVPDHVSVRPLDAKSKTDILAIRQFLKSLRKGRPDVLQSFLFFDNTVAKVCGALTPGVTVVTGVREVPDSMNLFRHSVDRLTLPLADYIVSNSRAGAEWVIDRGANPEVVEVVHNGRKADAYDIETPPGFRERLGIPEGPIVGNVGRLVTRKGQYDLVNAWPTVHNHYPNAQLVIVGDGPESEGLEHRADRLGVSDSVHLLGRRDDIPELLSLFDLFAFPSHYEGLPGALLEAMCAGLPIVATPVDGNSELITDGENGLMVPPRNPSELALTIVELLDDEPLAEELGHAAKSRAAESFSIEEMVTEYEALYRRVSS